MFRFPGRRLRMDSIKSLRWELTRVEYTRLGGEPVLCAMGKVLSAPFQGSPMRVFFVPRENDTISTPGYIRCLKSNVGVSLPNIVVLSGRPEFLTELEPILDSVPSERVVLDFSVKGRRRRSGDAVLEVIDVAVHASLSSRDFGLAEEELH